MAQRTGEKKLQARLGVARSAAHALTALLMPFVLQCNGLEIGKTSAPDQEGTAYSDQALVQAIMDGDKPKVSAILKGDINPDARNRHGDTALIWAVNLGDRQLAETLLERGADPNLGGTYGRAPLHWACRKRFGDLAGLLLDKGAAADLPDDSGETPLMQAVRVNDGHAVRLLLKRGADPNRRNKLGATPLSLAMEADSGETVEPLVLAGADLEVVAEQGNTVLSLLVEKGYAGRLATPAIAAEFPGLQARLEAAMKDRVVNKEQRPVLDPARIVRLIHQGVNDERRKYGLTSLQYDEDLGAIALAHSEDMALHNFFDHVNPEGEDPTRRAVRANYRVIGQLGEHSFKNGIGENIFKGYTHSGWSTSVEKGVRSHEYFWLTGEEIAKSAVEGWMNSKGHRANILNGIYEKEGIGLAIGEAGAVYITQDFW